MTKTRPYRPDVCDFCKAETWCEIRQNGKPQCRACKVVRFFNEFLYKPVKMRLLPWQEKVLRDMYGTLNMADGSRQYQSAYVSVSKQNGKSFYTGGLPLYHLLAEEDDIVPEVYGCASAKDQAEIVYKTTARLVRSNYVLMDRLKILDSKKRILRRDGNGFYAVLSADGDVQDGIRPSLLIRDEIHRWKTAKAETLKDVTTKGQISRYVGRYKPVDIAITTAGAEYESPLWWGEYQHAKQVLSGAVKSTTHYVAIWEADPKKHAADKEYWKSREARVAANPSHEDLGGHLKDAAIVNELEKALSQPDKKSAYLRYHLNMPLQMEEDPVIEMPDWIKCGVETGGGVDLREWPTYDVELLIKKWGLVDRPCWAGVDCSWTTDLTAVVFVFPPWLDDKDAKGNVVRAGCPHWTLLPFFWIPRDQIPRLSRICRSPFDKWVEQGFMEATPGPTIDTRSVVDRIKWGAQIFDLQEIPYDKLNFRTEALRMTEDGFTTWEVPQNFSLLSSPTKFVLSAYVSNELRHGNHPIMNWMAACLQLKYDAHDNCQPSKPERMKATKRIDGLQATVTALSRAMLAPTPSDVGVQVW